MMKNKIIGFINRFKWVLVLLGFVILFILLSTNREEKLLYSNWAIKEIYEHETGESLQTKRESDYFYLMGLRVTFNRFPKKFIVYTLDSTITTGDFELFSKNQNPYIRIKNSEGFNMDGVYSVHINMVNDFPKYKKYSLELEGEKIYFYCDKSIISLP